MSEIKKVAVIPHTGKKEVAGITKELCSWFEKKQIEVKIPKEDAQVMRCPSLGFAKADWPRQADLVVTLGGDGTFLRAVGLLEGKETPILGVNLGRLGFLCQTETLDLYTVLSRVLEGKASLDKRMMLEAEVFYKDKIIATHLALNEVVISRTTQQKILQLEVYLNDLYFNRYSCDGLIFATPTGSTAYSLSVGGPLIFPQAKAILVTPVCPHSFFARSLILSSADIARVGRNDLEAKETTISADGVVVLEDTVFDFVKIKTASSSANLVKVGKGNFYTLLKDKLKVWGVR